MLQLDFRYSTPKKNFHLATPFSKKNARPAREFCRTESYSTPLHSPPISKFPD